MPIKIRRLPKSRKYRVYNAGRIVARATTKEKARKQARLLRGLEHGVVLRKRGR
jgi:hypothetical protein